MPKQSNAIIYPYLPKNRQIQYVPSDNQFMLAAKKIALDQSRDKNVQTGSVIVKNGSIIGAGANDSAYHVTNECVRVTLNIPTGQGYELCDGCHPNHHSEASAIRSALKNNQNTRDADLYIWGHWWCCEPCWNKMIAAGIKNVYLLEGSETLFSRSTRPSATPSTKGIKN